MFTQICFWLSTIGGLNWGLVGLFNLDLISFIFGDMSITARVLYIIVGLSAFWIMWEKIKDYLHK